MFNRKETSLAPNQSIGDAFGLLRQMTSELDRVFDEPFLRAFGRPSQPVSAAAGSAWSPGIDVFERDNHLVTKVDLPGMKKEDVKVEVTDGRLVISGERTSEAEETKEHFYRCERAYGSFFRAVPLPDGVKLEDIKATFSEGVLEVSVPLPAKPDAKVRKIEIQESVKAAKTAA